MQSNIAVRGGLKAKVRRAPGPGLVYKAKNAKNVFPGVWRHARAKALGMNHILGTLRVRRIRADGSIVNFGLVSTNLVTTDFCEDMVDELISETSAWGDYKFHDSGIGTTPAAVGDADIETTDGETAATGTQVESSSVIYESVGTINYSTTKAITEHGLFNIVTGGILMDRHVFSAVNVENGDSIEFTYDLTCTAGG